MHVNKTYALWLMFRVLSNQHYQHPTNQKLSSWVNTVFQNHGVCGQAFPSLPCPCPSLSPVIPFSCCSRPNVLDELAQNRLLRRLVKLQFQVSVFTLITWLSSFFSWQTLCNSVSLPPTKVCVSLTAVYWVLECFSIFSFVFWKLFVTVVLLHDKWHSVCEKLWFLTVTHEITIHVNKLTFSG